MNVLISVFIKLTIRVILSTFEEQTATIIGKIKVRDVYFRESKMELVGICASLLSVTYTTILRASAHDCAVLIN